MVLKIVMIGSGNLASNLTLALYKCNHQIIQVFSRNQDNAKQLAGQVGAEPITSLDKLIYDADLYVVAVNDESIPSVLNLSNLKNNKVVHTSGSVPLSVFDKDFNHCGVLYPFQTFTKNRLLDFKDIPVFIEANNPEFKSFLVDLASQLSCQVAEADSETRLMIHLSGIFACNFVNHLYSIAGDILKKSKVSQKSLHKLIIETANKAAELGPELSQTGPARRKDQEILKKHLELLSSKPVYQQLYQLLSNDIALKYK